MFEAKKIINEFCEGKEIGDYIGMSVPLDNLLNHIDNHHITTHAEIDETIDLSIKLLEHFKGLSHKKLDEISACQHEFKRSTYTVRRMLINYVAVYERCCKKCGFTETHRLSEDDPSDSLPAWAENAAQRYYNNDI